jgi:1-acyl-sn-glycerol-3-phosphate acyltransferase
MNAARGIWRFAMILLYSLLCLFAAYTKFPKAGSAEKKRLLRYYSVRLLKMAGVDFYLEGEVCGPKPGETGLTVVSNHVSWMDIFALDAACPSRFIAKADIAQWPIFGKIAVQIGTLFVDRSRRSAIVKINEKVTESLQNGGEVALFAEGTTTCGNELLPLKANFLAPAAKLNSRVQPMVIVYRSRGIPSKRMAFAGDTTLLGSLWNVVTAEKATVTVYALTPIESAELDRHQLTKRCEEAMRSKLREVWGAEYHEFSPEDAKALAAAIRKDKNS